MKQTDWKIIYTKYEGVTKRAINLLSKEAGQYLVREEGQYSIHVLPCEKEGAVLSKNAFFISLYNDSKEIQKHVKKEEVPENGFLVKVIKNPSDEEGRFVILTANNEVELFYSVVSYLDDYCQEYAPGCGSNPMSNFIYDFPLCEYSYTETPEHNRRSIFTWGNPINDYRAYIDNMARNKLNELILWNDFIPLNIDEVIDYAHSYGIKVVLGYSWGWKEIERKPIDEISKESIEEIKKIAIQEYRDNYANVKCDGIYFQSFTERKEQTVGGKLIAEIVTEMVNEIANELWKITPNLHLIFGLHATSVRSHLDIISKVDEKIEILWEDCGEYPYNYRTRVVNEEAYLETIEFTKKLLNLRGGKNVGLVFKGVMMLDWRKGKFVHQKGPFVLGESGKEVIEHDKRLRSKAWRRFSADLMQNGARAYDMLKVINENSKSNVHMCIAGTFDGGIYLPFAVISQMYRKSDESYLDILKKVSRRSTITVD